MFEADEWFSLFVITVRRIWHEQCITNTDNCYWSACYLDICLICLQQLNSGFTLNLSVMNILLIYKNTGCENLYITLYYHYTWLYAYICTYRALLCGLRQTNTAKLSHGENWTFHSICIEIWFQREIKNKYFAVRHAPFIISRSCQNLFPSQFPSSCLPKTRPQVSSGAS